MQMMTRCKDHTCLHAPTSRLEAHNGVVAAAVVLKQARHVLQRHAPQRHSMQQRCSVICCQQCLVLCGQIQSFHDLPFGHAHIYLQSSINIKHT